MVEFDERVKEKVKKDLADGMRLNEAAFRNGVTMSYALLVSSEMDAEKEESDIVGKIRKLYYGDEPCSQIGKLLNIPQYQLDKIIKENNMSVNKPSWSKTKMDRPLCVALYEGQSLYDLVKEKIFDGVGIQAVKYRKATPSFQKKFKKYTESRKKEKTAEGVEISDDMLNYFRTLRDYPDIRIFGLTNNRINDVNIKNLRIIERRSKWTPIFNDNDADVNSNRMKIVEKIMVALMEDYRKTGRGFVRLKDFSISLDLIEVFTSFAPIFSFLKEDDCGETTLTFSVSKKYMCWLDGTKIKGVEYI